MVEDSNTELTSWPSLVSKLSDVLLHGFFRVINTRSLLSPRYSKTDNTERRSTKSRCTFVRRRRLARRSSSLSDFSSCNIPLHLWNKILYQRSIKRSIFIIDTSFLYSFTVAKSCISGNQVKLSYLLRTSARISSIKNNTKI